MDSKEQGDLPVDGKKNVPLWKQTWARISGVLLTVLLTVAGFASKEFRQVSCLDLPEAADLRYPGEPAGAIPFDRVASDATQSTLNGKTLTFRARYYGETIRTAFLFGLPEEKLKRFMLLNLRATDFVATDTPLGSTAQALPPLLVMVPLANADALVGLPMGTVLEITGKAIFLEHPEPGSIGGKLAGSVLPDYADFYVTASHVEKVEAINRPEERLLCRAFHDLK